MNTITINFTTRATYLEFKAEWAAQYKATVESIRKEKLALKECHRKNINTYLTYKALSDLRQDIVDLTNIKAQAKVEANRQYHESHSTQQALTA